MKPKAPIFLLFLVAASFFSAPVMSFADTSGLSSDALYSSAAEPSEMGEPVYTETNNQNELHGTSGIYPIHVGDKIRINVLGEKELSSVYSVDINGDIHFPLINKIHVEGLTLDELREALKVALGKNYLANPQIQVTFVDSAFNSVSVLGQVNKPGNYVLTPQTTFLRMISIAGGFANNAAYATCKLTRTDSVGAKITMSVDVEGILNSISPDIELKPGDVIFVPKIVSVMDEKDDYVNSIAVIGQVQKPGNYRLAEGMTLVKVLSQSGGLARGADAAQVNVCRLKAKDGKQENILVNIKAIFEGTASDVPLHPGDVVYVPALRGSELDIVDLDYAVSILGAVNKPGNYDFVQGMTMIQLISQAGGFSPVANTSRVRITRTLAGGSKKIMEVNVAAIMIGKADDLKLQAKDIVYVPESVF